MRPTIRPAMNTPTIAKMSSPYSPEPTPPNATSPSAMSTMGDTPPIGV